MKKYIILLLLILLISGCANSSSIKKLLDNPDKYVGKEVTIDGTVNVKMGKYGYPYISVFDRDAYILVQSKFDIEKNSNVTVKGVFSSDKSIGYYIKSRELKVK